MLSRSGLPLLEDNITLQISSASAGSRKKLLKVWHGIYGTLSERGSKLKRSDEVSQHAVKLSLSQGSKLPLFIYKGEDNFMFLLSKVVIKLPFLLVLP